MTDANEGPASSNESGPAPFASPTVPPTVGRVAGRCLLRGAVVGVAAGVTTFAIALGEFAAPSGWKKADVPVVGVIFAFLGAVLGLWTGAVGLAEAAAIRRRWGAGLAGVGGWTSAFAALAAATLNVVYIAGIFRFGGIEGGARLLRDLLAELAS